MRLVENEERQALERALIDSERVRRESESLRLLVASLTGFDPTAADNEEPAPSDNTSRI
jgi:hypothetical protein